MTTTIAPVDELRKLPPPLARAVLARVAAEHGPEAVAALRWQIEAWRRPAQQLVDLSEPWSVLVITGEFGSGKTWLAGRIFTAGILDWKVERPRIVAATGADVEETVVDGQSGITTWLPPWVPWSWQSSKGHEGLLTVNGVKVSCLSADAPAQAIGSGAGWVLADDVAKWVETSGEANAERAWASVLKSLREWPGRAIVPTTPDGASFITSLLTSKQLQGVKVLDLGSSEENRGNLAPAYLEHVANLRAQGLWLKSSGGAFAGLMGDAIRCEWPAVLEEIAISIDPAKSTRSHACEVGLVATGIDRRGTVYGLADRSKQMDAGQWPAAAHDLLEEMAERYHGARIRFVVENNAGGAMPAELLRAEEKIRRLQRGGRAVSMIEIREVTSRKNDGKARRAGPIVALAKGGQVRMVRGLGVLEGQLSALADDAPGQDRADAFVHGARDLAGISDDKAATVARREEMATEATRAAFAGLDASRERMPRVDFDLDRA